MLSEFKNDGGIQEQNCTLEDLSWFDALSQEEMITMLSGPGPVQLPDMQSTEDHSIPGSSNDVYTTARRLQLRFSTGIFSPVLTGKKIKGEGSETIKVILIDGHTGKQVDSGPEAFAEVEIVVLNEAFAGVRSDDWPIEQFDKNIVKEGKSKKSLLAKSKKQNPKLKLKEGCGFLDDISFTHNRNWQGKTRFRLGARIVDDLNRARVREAKTEPFELKDCRLEWNKKNGSPSLRDHVWRLKKVDREGNRHKRLREANIKTVKDFLILWNVNPQKLSEKYGGGGKNLDDTVSHALTCPENMVCYPSSSREQTGVVVNASAEVLGLLSDGKFILIDNLSDVDKANAKKSAILAFKRPENVDYYDPPSEHMQPSLSTEDTFLSESVDFYSARASNGEEVGSSTLMDDETLFNLCSTYGNIHDAIDNHLNCTNESVSVLDCISPFERAQKRWKIFSKVWSGAWYFIKKKAAQGLHAKKKLRLC